MGIGVFSYSDCYSNIARIQQGSFPFFTIIQDWRRTGAPDPRFSLPSPQPENRTLETTKWVRVNWVGHAGSSPETRGKGQTVLAG
jgi:hypothetical protein